MSGTSDIFKLLSLIHEATARPSSTPKSLDGEEKDEIYIKHLSVPPAPPPPHPLPCEQVAELNERVR